MSIRSRGSAARQARRLRQREREGRGKPRPSLSPEEIGRAKAAMLLMKVKTVSWLMGIPIGTLNSLRYKSRWKDVPPCPMTLEAIKSTVRKGKCPVATLCESPTLSVASYASDGAARVKEG